MSDAQRVAVGSPSYSAIVEWLFQEASLLDNRRYEEWLTLLAPEIDYRMPVRKAVLAKDGRGFDDESGFFIENYASLATRVGRLATEQAWSDQPVSRTRHFVSNVLATRSNGGYDVSTAFLVTRIRSDSPYDIFTGERNDRLVGEDGEMKLAKRTIYLDQTVLRSHNLSFFF